MSTYVTLGADKDGYVYGIEIGKDGKFIRNPLGYATPCTVVRPVSQEQYDYITEVPDSIKDVWKSAVVDDRTELGLQEFFNQIDETDRFDDSGVFELLEDMDNPVVAEWTNAMRAEGELDDSDEEDWALNFNDHMRKLLVNNESVTKINSDADIVRFEAAGWFPPEEPFVVEFAPKELLEEYYAHLRETYKAFKG